MADVCIMGSINHALYSRSADIMATNYYPLKPCQHYYDSCWTVPHAAAEPRDDHRFDYVSAGYCNYRDVISSCSDVNTVVSRRNEIERRRIR